MDSVSNPSGDGLHHEERPLVGQVVGWPRVPHKQGQRCRATALLKVEHGLTMSQGRIVE